MIEEGPEERANGVASEKIRTVKRLGICNT